MFEDTLHLSRISLDNIEEWTKQILQTYYTQQKTDKACEDCVEMVNICTPSLQWTLTHYTFMDLRKSEL